jgi:predicted RNA-binding protein with PIN domain
MSLHIIIDGYNLIRQSPSLSTIDQQDLQAGREALIRQLATYRRMRPHRITVVFDGTNAPPDCGRQPSLGGVHVTFSRRGELADAVIKRLAVREREKALVVSSDQEILCFAESRGAAVIRARDFESKMQMAGLLDGEPEGESDEGGWVPTTRKKGPRRRLSRKQRRNRIKTRKL